jgi:hypothetical protein
MKLIRLAIGLLAMAALFLGGTTLAQRGGDECSIPGKGRFSVGWVAEYGGENYRCLETFGDDLKPSGVAWIKVVKESRFVIKD